MIYEPPSSDPAVQELGTSLSPRFDAAGLISAIAQDAASGTVLMLAHMNAEALNRTLETGYAHYWSRSRQSLWMKGETSGERQKIVSLHMDCDQDAILLKVAVEGRGTACHNGFGTCFYRQIGARDGSAALETTTSPLASADDLYVRR